MTSFFICSEIYCSPHLPLFNHIDIIMNPIIIKFNTLHIELQQMMKEEDELDEELLQQKIMKYIAYMAEDYRNNEYQENLFDCFCENNGVAILGQLLRKNSFIAIKAFSLLFINLKDQIWVNFILCQPFVMEAIETKCDYNEQEWTEYYISFLKSLSIRLNETQIAVFYNKVHKKIFQKSCTYPIVFEAMKYFNHPDFMVRTSVMNIILELMKVDDLLSHQYFSRFPFTSYLVTFACEVYQLIEKTNKRLIDSEEYDKVSSKFLSNYSVDLSDYLFYFNDLIHFGTKKAAQIIRCTFEAYLMKPLLKMLMSSNKIEIKHAILLFSDCIKIIKDQQLADKMVSLLLRPKLSQQFVQDFQKGQDVYIPMVYQSKFNPHQFYWDKYKNDILGHCLEVFRDIKQFQVDYEGNKHQTSPQFVSEVNRMSEFIRFDLLANKKLQKQELFNDSNDENLVDNPFLGRILELLIDKGDQFFSQITTLLLKIVQNKTCSKVTLIQCQILRLAQDVKNFEENSVLLSPFQERLRDIFFQKLLTFDWQKNPLNQFTTLFKFLKLLIESKLSIKAQQGLLDKYIKTGNELREYLTKQNINQIVQNFQRQYHKANQSLLNTDLNSQIAFDVSLLPQNKWDENKTQLLIPTNEKAIIIHHIHLYWLFRLFVKDYIENYHQKEFIDFEDEYYKRFQSDAWKVDHYYKIQQKKTFTCEFNRKDLKKTKRITLIEDAINLMIAQMEADSANYKILVVMSWIKVTFEMSIDDNTKIEVSINNNGAKDYFSLVFDDYVRSSNVLASLNDAKWARYEEQLYFIYKFLNRTLNNE